MKPVPPGSWTWPYRDVAIMIAVSFASWAMVGAIAGPGIWFEVLLGMLAPVAAVAISWVLTERTWRRHPERLTTMMIGAFGTKLLFFGVYVAVVIAVVGVRPRPFAASFAAYFIALYLFEALLLRRLLAGG